MVGGMLPASIDGNNVAGNDVVGLVLTKTLSTILMRLGACEMFRNETWQPYVHR